MKIGILGSGTVGQQLALGFAKLGHEVKIGTRSPDKLAEFIQQNPNSKITIGSFEESSQFADVIVLATLWQGTESAINLANKSNFKDKIIIDVTNPLDFSQGNPPKLLSSPNNSAGEYIQKLLPESHIVKAFNTISAYIMCSPRREEGDPDLFIAGNNIEAKQFVISIAREWGWKDVHDIGNIEQSYLIESLAMLWITYAFKHNHWSHAFKLLKK